MNVTITSDADRRLWAFIRSVKTEIGGWGYASVDERGDLLWHETFLIPQVVTASEVDFDTTHGDDVAIQKALDDGVLDDPDFVWVSWHSHHTMKAFWSGTDDKRIDKIGDAGVKRLLSFVGCHDGEHRLRLDVFGVEAHGLRIGQVTMDALTLHSDPDDVFAASISRELAANVRKPPKLPPITKNTKRLAPGVPSMKQSKPGKDPAVGEHTDGSKLSVGEAFDVKEFMEQGFTYSEALEWVEEAPDLAPLDVGDNGWFVGAAGVVDPEGNLA